MLNYEYPPLGGGAANANRYLLEYLDDRGIEVDLVTSSENGYLEEDFSDGISIYRVDVGKDMLHHWKNIEIVRYFFRGLLKSYQLKRSNNYDLVHAWFGLPCGLMALLLRKPYLLSLRGSDVPGFNERFSKLYVLLRPLIRTVWRNADAVVANSQDLKSLALETLEIDITVIENGVDLDEFSPDNSGGKTVNVLEALSVARLTSRKRLTDVINAVKALENVNLTVVGDGVLREKLEDISDDSIQFKGRVEHEDIHEFYEKSDVFVHSSKNEGMSNTLLEACSSGLPIIATDTGDSSKLVQFNGFLVDMESPDEIKKCLKIYRDRNSLIEEHGERSREIAESMTWDNVAEKYILEYNLIRSNKTSDKDERKMDRVF